MALCTNAYKTRNLLFLGISTLLNKKLGCDDLRLQVPKIVTKHVFTLKIKLCIRNLRLLHEKLFKQDKGPTQRLALKTSVF
jgi:hypothetical protein